MGLPTKSPVDRRQFLTDSLAAAALFTVSRSALVLGGTAPVRDFVVTAREPPPMSARTNGRRGRTTVVEYR